MKNPRTPRLSDLIRSTSSPGPAEFTPPPRNERAHLDAPAIQSDNAEAFPAPADLTADARLEPTPPEAEARRDYELLEQWLAQLFSTARLGALEGGAIFEDVAALIRRPKVLDALFAETFKTRAPGDFFARKSLNVGIYALRLARALGFQGEPLVDIGVAALFHKIGFARLSEDLVTKHGALSRRELASVKEHPRLGALMIAALGGPFERVAEIVAQTSERADGSGYPLGLKGDDVRTEALIIGLVDVFEALIQPRPYRERMIPFGAVKEILEQERNRFPRTILREFIASFSVFPPFTYVRLNSKAIARVVDTEPGYPLRPLVVIVIDAAGHKVASQQPFHLRKSPLLYITGTVSEDELPA